MQLEAVSVLVWVGTGRQWLSDFRDVHGGSDPVILKVYLQAID